MDWAELTHEQKVSALMNGGLPRQDAERQVAILDGASPVDVRGGLPPAAPVVPAGSQPSE